MRYKGRCTLLEVKAVDGNAKSVRTILKHQEKYKVHDAIKLGDYNINRTDVLLPLLLSRLALLPAQGAVNRILVRSKPSSS